MTSPVVTRLLRSNRSVVQHIETNAERLDERLKALLKPHLRAGEKMPDFALALTLMGRLLAAQASELAAADDANEAEKLDDPALLRALEEANDSLYKATVRAREMLAGAFTAKALGSLGFKGDTPRAPDTLVRFVTNVLTALDSHTLSPADDGASVDVKKLVKRLQPARDKVHAPAGDALREARELQQTQAAATPPSSTPSRPSTASPARPRRCSTSWARAPWPNAPAPRRAARASLRPKKTSPRSPRYRPPDARTTPRSLPATARQDPNDP
ncbi:MAG: hypothetical protein IPN17_18730 [Deltaproteobacteria bacterium]|nr:hypothetical protein [Deltaproteobacteria bacterium]